MLRCVIVDDEPLAVALLEKYVSKTPSLEHAGSWNDPVQALTALPTIRPDILFLDIQMPDLDGLELSRMVPECTRVIFTTAFKQYAFESYEVSALDFLLKPISYQKFLGAVEKARAWFDLKSAAEAAPQKQNQADHIFLKAGGSLRRVEFSDILFIEGMKDYVMVHIQSEESPLVTHITMKALEEQLPSELFMRVHKSYIVSLQKVGSVTPDGDIVFGRHLVHVSDAYKDRFYSYIRSKII